MSSPALPDGHLAFVRRMLELTLIEPAAAVDTAPLAGNSDFAAHLRATVAPQDPGPYQDRLRDLVAGRHETSAAELPIEMTSILERASTLIESGRLDNAELLMLQMRMSTLTLRFEAAGKVLEHSLAGWRQLQQTNV